jgi:hypothetical protein
MTLRCTLCVLLIAVISPGCRDAVEAPTWLDNYAPDAPEVPQSEADSSGSTDVVEALDVAGDEDTPITPDDVVVVPDGDAEPEGDVAVVPDGDLEPGDGEVTPPDDASVDPCADVVCDDSDAECQTHTCNPETGVCETALKAGWCFYTATETCVEEGTLEEDNPCMACSPETWTGEPSEVEDGFPCGDASDLCVVESCYIGVCLIEDAVTCDDDGDPCTSGSCDPSTGECVHTLVATDAPEFCDGTDNNCDGQVDEGFETYCKVSGEALCAAIGAEHANHPCQVCTQDGEGASWSLLADGESCDDSACLEAQTCVGGSCQGGQAANCDDANPCTLDSCDESTGCVNDAEAVVGQSCTVDVDALFCSDPDTICCATSEGACIVGECLGNESWTCDVPPLTCQSGSCGAAVDGCNVAVNEGYCVIDGACIDGGAPNPTNPCQVCDPGVSQDDWSSIANGSVCTSGNLCFVDETCSAGVCTNGAEVPCDDGIACTEDSCDAATGCTSLPKNNLCADTDCSNGVCSADTGCFQDPNAAAEGNSCDDGNACTATTTCMAGTCAGGVTTPCDDGFDCTADACNPDTGTCEVTILDGYCFYDETECVSEGAISLSNECLACHPEVSQTEPTSVEDGVSCEDNDFCSATSVCLSGACSTETAFDCEDGLSCTVNSCDSEAAACTNSDIVSTTCLLSGDCYDSGDTHPEQACLVCDPTTSQITWSDASSGAPCDDGNACTENDQCQANGVCDVGPAKDCTDDNPCTADACDSTTGECTHQLTPTIFPEVCDGLDNNCDGETDEGWLTTFCSLPGEGCVATGGPHPDVGCLVCAGDSGGGDAAWGVAPEGAACGEGPEFPCVESTCTAGVCGSTDKECDDGLSCTFDTCHEELGCQYEVDGELCDDHNPCTLDTCGSGGCEHEDAENGAGCDDGDPCTQFDLCSAGSCYGTDVSDVACDDGEVCTLYDTCQLGDCLGQGDVCGEMVVVEDGSPNLITVGRPRVAHVGGGRYVVASSDGAKKAGVMLRWTDAYGSREDETTIGGGLTGVSPTAQWLLSGYDPALVQETAPLAVQAGGRVLVASWLSAGTECVGPDEGVWCDFAALHVQLFDKQGELLAEGAGHKNTLHIWANSSMTWGGVAYLSARRAVPIAFSDGTFGLCSAASFVLADHPTAWPGDRSAAVASDALRCSKVLVDEETKTLTMGEPTVLNTVSDSLFDIVYDAETESITVAGVEALNTEVWFDQLGMDFLPLDNMGASLFSYGDDLAKLSGLHIRQPNTDTLLVAWSQSDSIPWHKVFVQSFDLAAEIEAPFIESLMDAAVLVESSTDRSVVTDLAVFSDGGAVVAWEEPKGDAEGYAARARFVGGNGLVDGDALTLNQTVAGDQRAPAVDVLDDDAWIAAFWGADNQVYTRHYDRTGAPVPGEVERLVSVERSAEQSTALSAQSPKDGTILMVWASTQNGEGTSDIFARRFAADGAPLTADIPVSSHPGLLAWEVSAVVASQRPEGGWIVAWAADTADAPSTAGDVVIQRIASNGTLEGVPIILGSDDKCLAVPSLVADPNGFMVAWEEYRPDIALESAEHEIAGQLFDHDGTARSMATKLNPDPEEASPYVHGVTLAYVPDLPPQPGRYIVGWNERSWVFFAGETGTDHVKLAAFEAPETSDIPLTMTIDASIVTPTITEDPAEIYILEALIANGAGVVACIDPGYAAYDEMFHCQRFTTGLVPFGAPIYPAESDAAWSAESDAAFLTDGSWVVAWHTTMADGPSEGVQIQGFNSTGQPQGPRRVVNRTWAEKQWFPKVSALDTVNPTALVTWQADGPLFTGSDPVFRFVPLL